MKSALIICEKTDSTNLAVRRRFSDLADGSLFCAMEQTAGKGRLNRRWITPPGSAICASGVMKDMAEPFHAGAVIALAALELIAAELGDERAYFKWPNDIYIGSRKLAGILSEGIFEHGRISGIISGIGININQTPEMLSTLDNPATSLFCECGKTFDIRQLYQQLFERFNAKLRLYRNAPDEIIRDWKQANRLLGKPLEAIRPDGSVVRGIFSGILPDGAMQLSCADGVFRFDCGDIKIDPAALPEVIIPANPNR